jgi:hypothetical protein
MSSRHLASSDAGERGRAVERLRAAVVERNRTHKSLESTDRSDDVQASASLRAADQQVAAREAWLKSVDDHS